MLSEEDKDDLYDAIVEGNRDGVVTVARKAVDQGEDIEALLQQVMIPAMGHVGQLFSAGEIFVPEMLVAARAMQVGLDIIEPVLAASDHEPLGRVCIGSVKGDLHDIGKNVVVMMLKGAGFEVDDLGVDVPVEKFEAAVERGSKIICLSALLTTTKPQMRTVVEHFRGRNDVRIVIGGAVVTEDYARAIGADGFGEDAPGAVTAVRRCLEAMA